MQRASTKKKRIIDEEQIIRILWKELSRGRSLLANKETDLENYDPFSDDVSWIRNSRNSRLIISKADMLVSDTDCPPQMNGEQIASKAITAAVSDFAAKGAKPAYCMISLAIPRMRSTPSFITSLGRGFNRAARTYALRFVGGDTNESKNGVMIDVILIGFSNSLVKRSGANLGDLVGVSGRFGLQRAGLLVLLGKAKSSNNLFLKRSTSTVLNPRAKLRFGLASAKYLSSSTDSSDGLALSLYHLAEESRVDIHLDSLPTAFGISRFSDLNAIAPEELVFFGGEEYELVFTFPMKYKKILEKQGAITIGKVTNCENTSHPRVYLEDKVLERRGWIHNQ